MSTPTDDEQERGARTPTPPPTLAMQNTPNAEKYVLEADAMRRRQLRSALLHGSRRTWREHSKAWPAVVVGIIVVAVIVAGLAVTDAFRKTEANEKEQQAQQSAPPTSAPASPGPSSTGPSSPGPSSPVPSSPVPSSPAP